MRFPPFPKQLSAIRMLLLLVAFTLATAFIGGCEDGDAVEVPRLSGMTEAEARDELEAAGLTEIETTRESSTEVAEGLVITTEPESGSEMETSDTVVIVVSGGP